MCCIILTTLVSRSLVSRTAAVVTNSPLDFRRHVSVSHLKKKIHAHLIFSHNDEAQPASFVSGHMQRKAGKKGNGNGERNKSDDGVDNSDDYNNFDVDAGPSLLLTQYDDDDDDCDDFDAAER